MSGCKKGIPSAANDGQNCNGRSQNPLQRLLDITMNQPLHSMLRAATHPQHVAINRHPLIEGLTKPGFPLANYLALLRSYAALYHAIEPAIDQWLTSMRSPFSYSNRHKLPWILQDLEYFGVTPFTTLQTRVPEINNWGALVGTLYAIEGSTLGGQVISRSLAAHLGLGKQSGARFFNGYGDSTHLMWDEFLEFSGTVVTDRQALCEAQQAAQACFALFEHALDCAQHHLAQATAETNATSQ